jgi:regulator of protease activity HflC (stomatin/prohibitin superfamily)
MKGRSSNGSDEAVYFAAAAQNVAATTLRSVVGDMMLDDVHSKREDMNASLRMRLDDVTERWGVKVTTVEVREVNPPDGVLQAMTHQMSAERTRRAVITEAQSQKEAAVTLAEGNRQAAILGAEGEQQAAILRAEGLATALDKVAQVGGGLDQNTMQLQYLQALRDVGTSPSSKVLVPTELGSLGPPLGLMPGTDSTQTPDAKREAGALRAG